MSPEGTVVAEEVWKRFRSDQQSRDFKDLFRRLRTRRRRESRGWRWVLNDVSLTVEPGTSMALIGGNGSGKSTMLKILAGVMDPYAGRVDVVGRIGALIEVRAGIHQELSGRENIFLAGSLLGLSRRSVTDRFDEIVHFAELERRHRPPDQVLFDRDADAARIRGGGVPGTRRAARRRGPGGGRRLVPATLPRPHPEGAEPGHDARLRLPRPRRGGDDVPGGGLVEQRRGGGGGGRRTRCSPSTGGGWTRWPPATSTSRASWR